MFHPLSFLVLGFVVPILCWRPHYEDYHLNCSDFAHGLNLASYNTTVLNSTQYATGSYQLNNVSNIIPFCQIFAAVYYGSQGEHLIFATWLPDEDQYHNRFIAAGDGGLAGALPPSIMLGNLNSGLGFAVAGGDGGHRAEENNGGQGAPGVYLPFLHDSSQINAWIHDGISLFTPAAKAITEHRYSRPIKHSYYNGCSTGGAQGFALAQFHPGLFDGIIAGCPGNWYSHLALSFLWNAQHTATNQTEIPQAQLTAMTTAVLDACDTLDGVKDRLIEDPLACHFDVNSFGCDSSSPALNKSTCLTASQLEAVKAIYNGPKRSDNGNELYPGFSFGSENAWAGQEGPLAEAFSIPLLQNVAFDNLSYDASTFDYASEVDIVDLKIGKLIDEIDPALHAFQRKGGKMLVYQGWADPYNAALWPIEHLKQIQSVFDGDVSSWFELFMIPGGGHCGTSALYPHVPAVYETVSSMVAWVEQGIIPKEIESTTPPDGSATTRKLCPWPKTAKNVGGTVSDWTSYACR